MKLDLIEIANVPYRNHKAEIYSAKVRKINYLKKNFVSILIGCVIGIPVSLYAVNHQEPSTIPVHYDTELFEQTEQVEQKITDEEDLKVNFQSYEMTPDDIALEEYYDSLELLACCVEAEAGNQGLVGKKYVVDVVLNRVDDADYPDNITDVIMQRNQFSVVLDGRIWEVEPTEETFQAVREELENRTDYEVLFFTSVGFSQYGTAWEKIGDHYFSRK
jgi:spore germination cell wall hydrolase CwlJ-like protein